MALTEEQKIIEAQIKEHGYNWKFDVQLQDMKRALRGKLVEIDKEKTEFSLRKAVFIAEEVSISEVKLGEPDENGETQAMVDDDGNSIELSEDEKTTKANIYYESELQQFVDATERVNFHLDLITDELLFRNEGLVVREPSGTTYYCSYDGDNSNPTSPATAYRWLNTYFNASRTAGDILIVRRVRGGFNPAENIWINNYSKYKYTAHNSDGVVTEDDEIDGNYESTRSPGYVAHTGQISAFLDSTDFSDTVHTGILTDSAGNAVVHPKHATTPWSGRQGTGFNLSGTAVTHKAYTMIGDLSRLSNGVRLPRQIWTELIDPNSSEGYQENSWNYRGDNNKINDNSNYSYTSDLFPNGNANFPHATANSNNPDMTHGFTGTWWSGISRQTNPRDKSRYTWMAHREYDMLLYWDVASSPLYPISSGKPEDPIIVTADYENVWGDFLDTGSAVDGTTSTGHDGEDSQYKVDVGSKIIRRMNANNEPVEVHSYITPGDWIFVGSLESTGDPARVNAIDSDDPYEYSYCVRDVNYDKIVLWHPYKGEKAGINKRLVSMGYAPRLWSPVESGATFGGDNTNQTYTGKHMSFPAIRNWHIQGLELYASHSNGTQSGSQTAGQRSLIMMGTKSKIKFKDCNFFGTTGRDSHIWNDATTAQRKFSTHSAIWLSAGGNNLELSKCVLANMQMGIYDAGSMGSNEHKNYCNIKDSIFNGSLHDNFWSTYSDHQTADSFAQHTGKIINHKSPEYAIRTNSPNTKFNIEESEFVNWRTAIIKKEPDTPIEMKGCKFLGIGMDWCDPFVNNNADAQENLGVRWARAVFAGNQGLHPATSNYKYAMIQPADDANLSLSVKKINITSGDYDVFGRYPPDDGTLHKGNEWFLYNDKEPTPGGTDTAGTTSIYNAERFTAKNAYRCYNSDQDWRERTGTVNQESGGAWGYDYQPPDYNPASGPQEGISEDNVGQTLLTNANKANDNNMSPSSAIFIGDDDKHTNWNNFKFFNGALGVIGAKGFSGTGHIIWDWDSGWRSGDGGSWALKATDGHIRFPHVYGGVRIAPSIPELIGKFCAWQNNYISTNWNHDSWWANENHRHNHPMAWYPEPDWLPTGAVRDGYKHWNFHQNSTLAPQTYSALNALQYPNANFNVEYDIDDSEHSFDYKLSNGPGFGIGSSPNYGVYYSYDTENSGAYDGYTDSYTKTFDQSVKFTSQDHYQLFLNYDYYHFVGAGHLGNSGTDFDFAIDKPLVCGVNGIAKGIIYQQGRFNHSESYGNRTDHYFDTNSHLDFSTNVSHTDPDLRVFNYANVPMMETIVNSDLIEGGGGNYLIKVFPTDQIGGGMEEPSPHKPVTYTADISDGYTRSWSEQSALMILEYPFYLSTNSRTYTVKLRPDSGSMTEDGDSRYSFAQNPKGNECWLEMEYWETTNVIDQLRQARRLKRTNSTIEFGTAGWKSLSLTVTPLTEGVGYLRLFWGKAREANKVNTFYVDPKVVVY